MQFKCAQNDAYYRVEIGQNKKNTDYELQIEVVRYQGKWMPPQAVYEYLPVKLCEIMW